MSRFACLLALLACASAFELRAVPLARSRCAVSSLHGLRLQEGKPEPVQELSSETIAKAAEVASAPGAGAPSASPGAAEEEEEVFDPRIIVYVSLPALVLLGQLFFTFSRDALGDTALGPAVMDLWVP